jgi:hypothetical protein
MCYVVFKLQKRVKFYSINNTNIAFVWSKFVNYISSLEGGLRRVTKSNLSPPSIPPQGGKN